MFTGIITALGEVKSRTQADTADSKVTLTSPYRDLEIGESIAVNGVCLTLTHFNEQGLLEFYVSKESYDLSNLREARWVNLERALRLGDRLSGHWVQGHVDGQAYVISVEPQSESHRLLVEIPKKFENFITYKGSITLNGVSLTINQVSNGKVELNIIPHTWETTNFKHLKTGDILNLEVDILAKYVLNPKSLSSRELSP